MLAALGGGPLRLRPGAQYYSDIVPKGYLTSSGDELEGSLVKEARNNWNYNTGVTLTSIRRFWEVTNTTKVGVSYENQLNRILADTAGGFVVGRVPEFGGVDRTTVTVGSREEKIKNQNYPCADHVRDQDR